MQPDLLGLPVSYNNHTSLVVVVQPFAAATNISCIMHMDSIAGGEHTTLAAAV